MATIVATLNASNPGVQADNITLDINLTFKVYNDTDSYAVAEAFGSHVSDADVTVSAGVVTITNVVEPIGLTAYKISSVDEALNESILSVAFAVTGGGWTLAGATYVNAFTDISATETVPVGIAFKPDGTKVFIHGNTGNAIYQSTLSTPWDLSTLGAFTSGSTAVGTTAGIHFNPDGSEVFILLQSSNAVYRYPLSVAWDVTTVGASSNFVYGVAGGTGLTFNPSGTKAWISYNTDNTLQEYSLTAWDISTMALVDTYKDFLETGHYEMSFDDTGTKLFMLSETPDCSIVQYKLSVAYDISTIDRSSYKLELGVPDNNVRGLYIKPDGSQWWGTGITAPAKIITGLMGSDLNDTEPTISYQNLSVGSLTLSAGMTESAGVFTNPNLAYEEFAVSNTPILVGDFRMRSDLSNAISNGSMMYYDTDGTNRGYTTAPSINGGGFKQNSTSNLYGLKTGGSIYNTGHLLGTTGEFLEFERVRGQLRVIAPNGTKYPVVDASATLDSCYAFLSAHASKTIEQPQYALFNDRPHANGEYITWTLGSTMTKNSDDYYEGADYTNGTMISTVAYQDFDFRINIESRMSNALFIGVTTSGTLGDYTGYDYGIQIPQSAQEDTRDVIAGVIGGVNLQTIARQKGDILRLVRTGTSLKAFYNGLEIKDFGAVGSGTFYLNASTNGYHIWEPKLLEL